MGMTIEDAILCLKGIKQYGSDTFTKRSQGDWQNSLDLAIATMRKYQKIQEIVKNTQQLCSYGSAFIDIREVIKDGNDN